MFALDKYNAGSILFTLDTVPEWRELVAIQSLDRLAYSLRMSNLMLVEDCVDLVKFQSPTELTYNSYVGDYEEDFDFNAEWAEYERDRYTFAGDTEDEEDNYVEFLVEEGTDDEF